MGKCKRCGRKGFFFKVNSDRLCKNCEVLEKLENEEKVLNQKVSNLSSKLSDQEKLMKELSDQAKEAALADIIEQISQKNEELQKAQADLDSANLAMEEVSKKESLIQKKYEDTSLKIIQLNRLIKSIRYALKKYTSLQVPNTAVILPF